MTRSSGALVDEPPDEFVLPGGTSFVNEGPSFELAFKRDRDLKGIVHRAEISIDHWSRNIGRKIIEAEHSAETRRILDRGNVQGAKMNLTTVVIRTLPLIVFFLISILIITSRNNMAPAITVVLLVVQVFLFVISVRAWVPKSHR